jgi:SAM-dependent methyltransferase
MKSPLAEGSALLLGTGVSGIAAYLFIVVGTRFYGAEAFAPVSVLWSLWAVSAAVFTFPVQHWMIRRIELDGHDGGVRAAIPRLAAMALVVTALQVVVAWALGGELFRDQRLVWPALVGAVTLGAVWSGLIRGSLAGTRRFFATALMISVENLVRLAGGLAAVFWAADVAWFAGALVLGPLIGFIWFDAVRFTHRKTSQVAMMTLLGGLAGGTLLAQVVLSAGPAVLSMIGGTAVEITALFTGLALFRIPHVLALGLAARGTGPLTAMVVGQQYARLGRVAVVITSLAVAAAALGGLFGRLSGPWLIRWIFGADMVLPPNVVAGVAAGNFLALGSLGLTLLLIARSATATISFTWVAALLAGVATLYFAPGDPLARVVLAFFVSESTALVVMFSAQALWIRGASRQPEAESPHPFLSRIAAVLVCPTCRGPLEKVVGSEPSEDLGCAACGSIVYRRGTQFLFQGLDHEEVKADWLNKSKEIAKRRLGHLYPYAIKLLAPVHTFGHFKKFVTSFDTHKELVADLGCGTKKYDHPVLCVDGVGYANVHVVTDLETLPFHDGSLDGVISVAVLEHVPDPASHVREMRRVLKPGGRVLCFIPFMQGYHASPHDYQRYTIPGLQKLFDQFEIIKVGVGAGPTSGMLWVLQEWLALTFSFGSRRLYRALVPLTWILSPLKYFDILLARHPEAQVIASGYVIEGRKISESQDQGRDL